MKKRLWKTVCCTMTVIMLICASGCRSSTKSAQEENFALEEEADVNEDMSGNTNDGFRSAKKNLNDINVGDVYIFGSYEQDNNEANGKEDIEWQVLEKDGTKILVISKYALDYQPYNTEWEAVTWETCSLREWLNDEFINTAFSDEEKAMIPTVVVTADENPYPNPYGDETDPGNDTQDQIFLLSIIEVEKYFDSDDARECEVTASVRARDYYGWWLRSPGFGAVFASNIDIIGRVDESGYNADNEALAVRPALWIDLEP